MTTHVQINFRNLRRPADIGVARASVFLGLASNAAEAKPLLSHVLEAKMQFKFVPDDVSPETSAHFIEEFTYWTIGNALRELVDAFSAFLIDCRPALHMIETGKYVKDELTKLSAKIESKNITQQYEEVQEIAGLDPLYADMLETFRQARNCLAHRRGVVAHRDVNTGDGHFKLRWCFMGIYVHDLESGVEKLLEHGAMAEGIQIGEAGGDVFMRLTWKEEKFPVGSQIKLDRYALEEICFGVHLATCHVISKLHEFALANGIPDADLENASESAAELPQNAEPPDSLDRED